MERVLDDADRSKLFDGDDEGFYRSPRFVQHVDGAFRERLTELYRALLSPGDDVFDAMSSWVSHLPDDRDLGTVVGHGRNSLPTTASTTGSSRISTPTSPCRSTTRPSTPSSSPSPSSTSSTRQQSSASSPACSGLAARSS
jgi:hypothetical protein